MHHSKPLAHALGSMWGEGQLDEIAIHRGVGITIRKYRRPAAQHSSADLENVGEAR